MIENIMYDCYWTVDDGRMDDEVEWVDDGLRLLLGGGDVGENDMLRQALTTLRKKVCVRRNKLFSASIYVSAIDV